jgi:hypothetical protein
MAWYKTPGCNDFKAMSLPNHFHRVTKPVGQGRVDAGMETGLPIASMKQAASAAKSCTGSYCF